MKFVLLDLKEMEILLWQNHVGIVKSISKDMASKEFAIQIGMDNGNE
jgi:hypothetical protein